MANGLISIWKVHDLRYNISVYGDYFQSIPRRLGTSPALDAATWAFACAHSAVYTGYATVQALAAYGTALRKISDAVKDPIQKHEPNTLISLHLVYIVQMWISKPTDPYANHTMVMAYLLPDMIAQGWKDPVDNLMLVITAMLVITSAARSSRIPVPTERIMHLLTNRPYRDQGL